MHLQHLIKQVTGRFTGPLHTDSEFKSSYFIPFVTSSIHKVSRFILPSDH